jgi:large subunit ribosomal protein L17
MYRRLGLRSDHRNSMFRNMATSLLREERIETTEERAKEIRRVAEHMISLGKRGDLHAKKQALSYLFDESVVKKLFDEIAPKYKERNGGYTRILKTGYRRGDGASMVLLELV